MSLLAQIHCLSVVHQQDPQQLIAVVHLLLNASHHRWCIGGDVFNIAGDREIIERHRHGEFFAPHRQHHDRLFHRAKGVHGVVGAEKTTQAGKRRVIQFDHLLSAGQRIMRQRQSQLLKGQYPGQRFKVGAWQHGTLQAAFADVAYRLLRPLRRCRNVECHSWVVVGAV
ncbi:hypothetical protein D3C86_1709100 [compost metagenome]